MLMNHTPQTLSNKPPSGGGHNHWVGALHNGLINFFLPGGLISISVSKSDSIQEGGEMAISEKLTTEQFIEHIKKRLPKDFGELKTPELKLDAFMKACDAVLTEHDGLATKWVLLNAEMTLLDLVKPAE